MSNMISYIECHKKEEFQKRDWIDHNYQCKLIEDIKSCVDMKSPSIEMTISRNQDLYEVSLPK
jgi:hypothetical protein